MAYNIDHNIKPHMSFLLFIFRCVRKIAKRDSLIMSVCTEKLGSHWKDFHEIWYLNIVQKSSKEIQVSLKSDKNNACFLWNLIYIFDHILLSSSKNEKCFRQKLYRKSKHTFYIYIYIHILNHAIFEMMWKNVKARQTRDENNENMGHAHNMLDY